MGCFHNLFGILLFDPFQGNRQDKTGSDNATAHCLTFAGVFYILVPVLRANNKNGGSGHMKITTVSEMREMDRTAVEKYAIPELILMENAGVAAFSVLEEKIGVAGKRILVFCGSGNNGGDGFVVARKIHSAGGHARVLLLGNCEKIRGISKTNMEILQHLPVEIREVRSAEEIRSEAAHCHLMVDAILGTGLSKDVRGHYREIIDLMNRSGKPVLSLDIPSGVNGDNGQVMGISVKADWTVAFGLPKLGNLLHPGCEKGGKLYVTHISFPPPITESEKLMISVNMPSPLPERDAAGHKGDFGDVLFVAGAAGYYGAPYFAAMSFLKAGGGYARLAAPEPVTGVIAGSGSEIVFIPEKQTATGSLSLENEKELLALSRITDITVIGPGLSLDPETQQLVQRLVQGIQKPLIIDGDGITAVSQDPDILSSRKAPTILTPHLGEMARLTKMSIPDINADRIGILQNTASALHAYIVLKGAHSLIGYPNGQVLINMSGNSGMATAGSGDVLAGCIAAMSGLGLAVPDAVAKGVFIHGLAGDLAAEKMGGDGITARDIMEHLPGAVRADRKGLPEKIKERYAGARVVSTG